MGSFFFSFHRFGVTGHRRPSSAGCVPPPTACVMLSCPQCPRFAMGRFNDQNVAVGLKRLLAKPKKKLCFRKLWHLGSEHLHPSSSNAPLLLLGLAVPRHIRNNLDPSMLLPLNGEHQMVSLALVFPRPLKATIFFFLILPGSAKLALDLSFQLRLPVNKQHICCQSGADTERLMLLKLSRTS